MRGCMKCARLYALVLFKPHNTLPRRNLTRRSPPQSNINDLAVVLQHAPAHQAIPNRLFQIGYIPPPLVRSPEGIDRDYLAL